MRVIARASSVSLCAAMVVLFSPAITDGAESFDGRMIAAAPISLAMRVSSPIAGIRLLEDIFQRMHSIVALTKAKPVYAQQQAVAFSQAPTDPNLAIKPQEASPRKVALAGRMIPITSIDDRTIIASKDAKEGSWRPQQEQQAYSKPAAAKKAEAENADGAVYERKTANSEIASASTSNAALKQRSRYEKPIGGYDLDSPSATGRGAISGAATGSGLGNVGQRWKFAPGNYRNEQSRSAPSGLQSASQAAPAAPAPRQVAMADEEQHAGLKSLGESVNKLYKVTDQMTRAQSYANNAGAAGQQVASAQQKINVTYARRMAAASYNAPPKSITISQSPRVTEFGTNDKAKRDSGDAFSAGESGVVSEPQQSPGLFRNVREYDSSNLPKIAMRPVPSGLNVPNVCTGIPLVKLGAVATQIKPLLATKCNIKMQQVEGWVVWTLSKKTSSDTAIQLYIKHGMVEAMRVFDYEFLASDLGVQLGDDVQSLKSRFGEPAFIIEERSDSEKRASRAGQNYVYPINQVSFQLARAGHSTPQIVSVLIFNVK